MSRLGEFLKDRRNNLKLSLREIEKISGVSNAYLSMIESGSRSEPHPRILAKLAKAYEVDLATLMRLSGYVDGKEEDEELTEIEKLYKEATADPAFSTGFRMRGKVDDNTKKFIAEMYKELKRKTGSEND